VQFLTGVDVGEEITVDELRARFDAVCVATGAGAARDLYVPGRELEGIHLAMDFLTLQNRPDGGRPAEIVLRDPAVERSHWLSDVLYH